MLICAVREDLIVTVEMVNYDRVFEKQLARAGTADETDHGNQQRYRGPLIRVAESGAMERPPEAEPVSAVNTLVATRHERSALNLRFTRND